MSTQPMTWQQVKDHLDKLTPAQLAQEAIIFDSESNNYIALIQGQIATEADAEDVIRGSSSTWFCRYLRLPRQGSYIC